MAVRSRGISTNRVLKQDGVGKPFEPGLLARVGVPEHALAESLGIALTAPRKLDNSRCNGFLGPRIAVQLENSADLLECHGHGVRGLGLEHRLVLKEGED